jgi:hypothetical protein
MTYKITTPTCSHVVPGNDILDALARYADHGGDVERVVKVEKQKKEKRQ